MSVDFNKHKAIADLQRIGPHKIYCIQGYHSESDDWIEVCFFYKSEAQKGLEWIRENRPDHDGCGGEVKYHIVETKLTKWKGN